MEKITKYNKLFDLINQANYYTKLYEEGTPEISDKAWDDLYFEIKQLEEELDIHPKNSPTQKIKYEVVNKLRKVEHNHKMLSLEKTKSIDEVKAFISNKPVIIMSKMDGLTCSLTYQDGILVSAETRGNGLIGEDILHNIVHNSTVPQFLQGIKGKFIVDGEIICTLTDFEIFASDYKNPRNFAAGSIRLLDSKECSKRKLTFIAWDIIEGFNELDNLSNKLSKLKNYGFITVPFYNYPAFDADNNLISIELVIEQIKEVSKDKGYPIDGVVFKFDNISYGKSLGETSHHFKNAIAYKFYDETYETRLFNIEWSMGRTGILTPIAVFESVDIDGSEISRASLHNIDIMKQTLHGNGWQGQKLEIYRANMIIPQIYSAEEDNKEYLKEYFSIPELCPICKKPTSIRKELMTSNLYCGNPDCEGKFINKLEHFCGKKGLDIKGISKATLEKLINWGWIDSFTSLFYLKEHREEWIKKPGFGEKSVDKILDSISNSSNCELHQFLSAIGIPLIGTTASKSLAKDFNTYNDFRSAIQNGFKFWDKENFGFEMHNTIIGFDYTEADELVNKGLITFKSSIDNSNEDIKQLNNLVFAITGKVNHFKNRDELKDKIESMGGKVTGSISKNTNYLINNDKNSTSSKNKNAKLLNIPIISEDDFIETFGIII